MHFARRTILVLALAALPNVIALVAAGQPRAPIVPDGRNLGAVVDSVDTLGFTIDEIVFFNANPSRPICAAESIGVIARGTFSTGCFFVKSVEVIYRVPEVPTVRVVFDDGACPERTCLPVVTPWEIRTTFAGLPQGEHYIPFEFERQHCGPERVAIERRYAYLFIGDCSPTGCVAGNWVHPHGGGCDAVISKLHSAVVTFGVQSRVPLAGLEGEVVFDPPALGVQDLRPTGAAAGMHLSWTVTATGARFLLFATDGTTIPPAPGPEILPVIEVVAHTFTRQVTPQFTTVSVRNLLGSTVDGEGVPECPFPVCPVCRFAYPSALICAESACDVNHDGRSDVRDLVLMVRCLNQLECAERFDCNTDSSFNLDDVLCCARRILQSPCPECPPDTGQVRLDDRVGVRIGQPVFGDQFADVPVELRGLERLGAARLGLSYPSDRYDVVSVTFPEGLSDWLTLSETTAAEVALGWIRIAQGPVTPDLDDGAATVTLRLRLKPGMTAGGEVAATSGEFSGPDGVRLEVGMGRPAVTLGGAVRLALSANRPNPFSGETSFSLTLDRAADVEVGIFDVGGRAVASLHRGRLPAGTHELRWNGLDSGGARVRSGIYFYRAAARGATVATRRMVMLGTP